LSDADKTRLTKRDTANVEAYQLYLKGRFYWWKTDQQEFKMSREYFHRAVEVDREYALGYCGLNSFYGFSSAWGMMPPEEGWTKAEWAIRKAHELDDTLAEVHLGMAALKMINKDWAGAEAETLLGIELNPQFDEIHYFHSFLLVLMGRFDEAFVACRRALTCNPFSLRINLQLANIFYFSRRYEEAVRQYRETIEMNPDDSVSHELLGGVFEQMSKRSEAIEESLQAASLAGDTEIANTIRSAANKGFERVVRDVARKKLERTSARV
jgi:tetratricopeptide (TPR) repeat protein